MLIFFTQKKIETYFLERLPQQSVIPQKKALRLIRITISAHALLAVLFLSHSFIKEKTSNNDNDDKASFIQFIQSVSDFSPKWMQKAKSSDSRCDLNILSHTAAVAKTVVVDYKKKVEEIFL